MGKFSLNAASFLRYLVRCVAVRNINYYQSSFRLFNDTKTGDLERCMSVYNGRPRKLYRPRMSYLFLADSGDTTIVVQQLRCSVNCTIS